MPFNAIICSSDLHTIFEKCTPENLKEEEYPDIQMEDMDLEKQKETEKKICRPYKMAMFQMKS